MHSHSLYCYPLTILKCCPLILLWFVDSQVIFGVSKLLQIESDLIFKFNFLLEIWLILNLVKNYILSKRLMNVVHQLNMRKQIHCYENWLTTRPSHLLRSKTAHPIPWPSHPAIVKLIFGSGYPHSTYVPGYKWAALNRNVRSIVCKFRNNRQCYITIVVLKRKTFVLRSYNEVKATKFTRTVLHRRFLKGIFWNFQKSYSMEYQATGASVFCQVYGSLHDIKWHFP